MKKDKLYLIISILFVAISIVLTNGFKGTYSAPESTIYWAVDGSSCTLGSSNCTLKISNNLIGGTHYKSGSFSSTKVISSYSDVPWYSYSSSIKNIQIGGEGDIISPQSTAYWFLDFYYITTVDLTYLDTSNVEDMRYMFQRCNSLTMLDLSEWNTSKVENMSLMFCDCVSLIMLDLSGWDTSSVTNMSCMFWRCESLTTLDLSGWNTSNVTDMSNMFNSCSNLEKIIGIENFDVISVEKMIWMFDNCKSLTMLDLSEWDTSNVNDYHGMFSYCESLSKIVVGEKWTLDLDDHYDWMDEETQEIYADGKIPRNVAATYLKHIIYWIIEDDTLTISSKYIENGENINTLWAYNYAGYYSYADSLPNIKKVVIGGKDDIIRPTNMESWFENFSNLEELDLTYLDTKYTTNMMRTFSTVHCENENPNSCLSSLKKIIGLENLDTSNVEDMSYMFAYNYSLEELDLSGLDTSNVEDMSYMFISDVKLKSIKGLENFNTTNVEDFTDMFSHCSSLNSLDLSNWDTRNGLCDNDDGGGSVLPFSPNPNMSVNQNVRSSRSNCTIFDKNTSLNEIKVGENFNIELPNSTWINKETREEYLGYDIPVGVAATYIKNGLVYWKLDDKKLLLSGKEKDGYNSLDTNEYILNQNNWKDYSDIIEEVIIEDSIKPTYMNEWFEGLTKVKKLDLSNVDTSNLQSVYKLVNDMDNLEELNLTNLDLSGINQCKYLNFEENDILSNYDDGGGGVLPFSPNPNINEKVESSEHNYCEIVFNSCVNYGGCSDFKNRCENYKLDETMCSKLLYSCVEYDRSSVCDLYESDCSSIEYNKNTCEAILSNYYYDERDIGDFPLYDDNCMTIGNIGAVCLENKYYYKEYGNYYAEEFLNTYCENFEVNEEALNETLENCMSVNYNSETSCEIYNKYAESMSESNCNNLLNALDEYYSDSKFEIYEKYCPMDKLNKNTCENILYYCWDESDYACNSYENYCSEIGNTGVTCIKADYYYDKYEEESDKEILDTYCENYVPTIEGCEEIKYYCDDVDDDEYCEMYDNYCEVIPITCDIFSNNKLKQISVDENNVDLVKESLSGPDNETGKWYDREGNPYDVSEILNEDKTYYSTKPSIVKYNAEVDDQIKYIGEDLTLYDEIVKDSETTEIITKFDTVGGNDIDDVTSLKITTYSLKDFTDGDGNTYLPGSKYTKDEDLELDVNYNNEDHYNEIELPIPVKHGYKFEYWTLDGERIDEYTPKTNKTLVAVWTEIKYNFIDGTDNVNYEEESEDKVIFITDGIIENFIGLYVNGKRFEKDEDYTLDGNKIILTEKGKEYLDSLEAGEYEVKAEFADSNDYVYGIIKVSEKEEPKIEPDNPKEEEPEEEPITPKTSDYILFTIIIALTALISSIFVYKKIEY